MTEPLKGGNGALFVQLDGPNSDIHYLGCHELGDIEEPLGDLNLLWCKDATGPNQFKVVGSYEGEPGAISSSVTTEVLKTADWLEALRCPATLFVHMIECGRQDVFENWARSFILEAMRVTSKRLSKLVVRKPSENDEATQSFDVQAVALHRLLDVSINRQAINETEALNDVVFCNDPRCQDDCGVAMDYCQTGFAVGDAQAGSALDVADVLVTADGGADGWLGTLADPFAAGDDIASAVCVEIGGGITRVIVARGTADGGPMDIAYSDDSGTTWTPVVVGAVDDQFATMGGTLFALDLYHIWLACTGGYVYFSDDAGITWTAQTAGTVTNQNLNHIDFVDENYGVAVGVGNAIIYTDDGGATWQLIAGPGAQDGIPILCVDVRDQYRWWMGYGTDGDLYYTEDAGTTFHLRDYPEAATHLNLHDITFVNDLVAFMVSDITGPDGDVYRTINGGRTWRLLTDTPTNTGLNAIWACNVNVAFIAGEGGVMLKLAA